MLTRGAKHQAQQRRACFVWRVSQSLSSCRRRSELCKQLRARMDWHNQVQLLCKRVDRSVVHSGRARDGRRPTCRSTQAACGESECSESSYTYRSRDHAVCACLIGHSIELVVAGWRHLPPGARHTAVCGRLKEIRRACCVSARKTNDDRCRNPKCKNRAWSRGPWTNRSGPNQAKTNRQRTVQRIGQINGRSHAIITRCPHFVSNKRRARQTNANGACTERSDPRFPQSRISVYRMVSCVSQVQIYDLASAKRQRRALSMLLNSLPSWHQTQRPGPTSANGSGKAGCAAQSTFWRALAWRRRARRVCPAARRRPP